MAEPPSASDDDALDAAYHHVWHVIFGARIIDRGPVPLRKVFKEMPGLDSRLTASRENGTA
ncbi:hypothetical protein [Mycobacterium paraterrae]|uniref:Uncharacterized protein n=1 Tax=Mycobacterium paraterrae TaxID=577492 RepID=A0ABY3VJB9_9MYCO|nr:hypothetical protein [Mycobacterium paraterrae]UMB69504.1 hypothetical protein MKK62_24735 [Mycobacterium paraterrae]